MIHYLSLLYYFIEMLLRSFIKQLHNLIYKNGPFFNLSNYRKSLYTIYQVIL